MGFFAKGSDADQRLRAARRALDEQHDIDRKALRRGDPDATDQNLKLQGKVRDAEHGASRGELFRR